LRLIEWKLCGKFIVHVSRFEIPSSGVRSLSTPRAISCRSAPTTRLSSESNHGAGVTSALAQAENCPHVETFFCLGTAARAHSRRTDFGVRRNLNVTLYIRVILPLSSTAVEQASGSLSLVSSARHVLASRSNRERTRIGAILRFSLTYPRLPPLLPAVFAHLAAQRIPHLEKREGRFATSGVKSIRGSRSCTPKTSTFVSTGRARASRRPVKPIVASSSRTASPVSRVSSFIRLLSNLLSKLKALSPSRRKRSSHQLVRGHFATGRTCLLGTAHHRSQPVSRQGMKSKSSIRRTPC
jgi:hypothetical protein